MEHDILDLYDKSKMYRIYDEWPKIAKNSYESNLELASFSDIDHIVFAGMGGSGAIGDVISSILSKTNIHVSVVKGYLLPSTVNSKTLVVPISISGNTVETLTILQSAQKLKSNIICFSSGGNIIDFCTSHNINYRIIKKHHSPRASFVSFLYGILKVLSSFLPICDDDVYQSIEQLTIRSKQISSSNLSSSNVSLELARWINDTPIIYYPFGLQSAAIRFKNSLNENSKLHAISEDIIESCHNGIVPWESVSNYKPILIKGKDDYVKTKERWIVIKNFFNNHNIDFKEIESVDGNILSKIVDLIYVLDFCTIYKAVLTEVDPSPVSPIDFIKNNI